MILTLEFRGAEFICVVCRKLYGFLAPVAKEPTPELAARYEELEAQYEAERGVKCRRCGVEDILDDRTGLCMSCHVGQARG